MKKILARADARFGKRFVRIVLAAVTVLLVGAFVLSRGGPGEVAEDSGSEKPVRTASVAALAGGAGGFSTVGTVRSVSEARLETESAGRVTAVRAAIGDRVAAGAVLAELENAAERGALTSAEGAYEASLISSSQVGTSAETTYQSAFTVADDVVHNVVDDLFVNPLPEQGIIGFLLDPSSMSGSATAINAERRAIETMLRDWKQNLSLIDNPGTNTGNFLTEAERDLERIRAFVARLALLLVQPNPNENFTEAEYAALRASFAGARTRLDATLSSVATARTSFRNGVPNSQSEAIMKQALGSLQAARAAYEKTLVRTPISGVVNAFYLRANEYVSAGAPAAVVANNGSLEVTTYINESEKAALAVGDSVMVGKTPGTITHIAPAIDPVTRKIEVRVSAEDDGDLQNGAVVRLTFSTADAMSADTAVFLPIVAVKLSGERAFVFTVEDNVLVAHEVELGTVRGDNVEIRSGVEADMEIVTDTRGLAAGETVEVMP